MTTIISKLIGTLENIFRIGSLWVSTENGFIEAKDSTMENNAGIGGHVFQKKTIGNLTIPAGYQFIVSDPIIEGHLIVEGELVSI